VPLMRRQSLKPIICRELHRRHAPGRSTDKPALPGIRAYPLRAGSIPARLSQGLRSQQIPSCKHRSDTCIVNGSSGQNLSWSWSEKGQFEPKPRNLFPRSLVMLALRDRDCTAQPHPERHFTTKVRIDKNPANSGIHRCCACFCGVLARWLRLPKAL
jgi:hypothetical protein